jgi:hypothetical protein
MKRSNITKTYIKTSRVGMTVPKKKKNLLLVG